MWFFGFLLGQLAGLCIGPLPVSVGHVTICKRSLVGGGDLVHHCDSRVLEASVLVRSVEL